jgi:hypothetical protein
MLSRRSVPLGHLGDAEEGGEGDAAGGVVRPVGGEGDHHLHLLRREEQLYTNTHKHTHTHAAIYIYIYIYIYAAYLYT